MGNRNTWLLAVLMWAIILFIGVEACEAGEYGNGTRARATADSYNSNVAGSASVSHGGSGGRGGNGGNAAQRQDQGFIAKDLVDNKNGVEIDLSNHSKSSIKNPRLPVAGSYAPGLVMGGNEVCMGSTSAGGQGANFGFSIGSTWTDDDCVRRKDATFMAKLGDVEAARQLMCQKSEIAKAYKDAGISCNMYRITPMKVDKLPSLDEPTEEEILRGPAKGSTGYLFMDGNA